MSGTRFIFHKLCFRYGTQEVLHDASADIQSGKITAVFGPNGSGKTTLLRCLAGLSRVDTGEINVDGRALSQMSQQQRSRLLAYVPQEHAVSFGYTVSEVTLMGRTPHLNSVLGPGKEDYTAAQRAIESVGIAEIASRPYTELSGGQRQLVLIARALAQETPIIIMDEPTSALDFRNQLLVWRKLGELKETGKTVLVCTHDPNHVLWFCDRIICLQDGRVIAEGSAKTLIEGDLLTQLYGSICTVQDGTVIPSFL